MNSPEESSPPDDVLLKTVGITEKIVFGAGTIASTMEGTIAMADAVSGENPLEHVEALGATVLLTACTVVAIRGLRVYFSFRGSNDKPGLL